MIRLKQWISLGALALTILTTPACERVSPVRTLPAWVRGVYVPMIRNTSYEPGLEEIATRMTQEAFLNDGRLDLVPKRQADMIIVAEIIDYRVRSADTTGDRVTSDEEVTLSANLDLYQPFNEAEPLARLGRIDIISRNNIDTRSIDFKGENERKRDILDSLARQIVARTITGFPVQVAGQQPGVVLPNTKSIDDVKRSDDFIPRTRHDRDRGDF